MTKVGMRDGTARRGPWMRSSGGCYCQPKTAHAHGCGYGAAALALITVIAPLCVAAAPDLRQSHSRHHERGLVFWLRSRMSISAPQTGQ
jgi:hypothetical protein